MIGACQSVGAKRWPYEATDNTVHEEESRPRLAGFLFGEIIFVCTPNNKIVKCLSPVLSCERDKSERLHLLLALFVMIMPELVNNFAMPATNRWPINSHLSFSLSLSLSLLTMNYSIRSSIVSFNNINWRPPLPFIVTPLSLSPTNWWPGHCRGHGNNNRTILLLFDVRACHSSWERWKC